MSGFTPKQINMSTINNGNEYVSGVMPSSQVFNDLVEGVGYDNESIQGLLQSPNDSSANNVGRASVYLVDTTVNGRTYKKFKFVDLKGETGATGARGASGYSVFLAYSANSNGSNFTTTWSSGKIYLGVYVGYAAPIVAADYSWMKFIGDTGAQGLSPFIKYSASYDGNPMSSTWDSNKKYIGFATALTEPPSYTEYTWCRFIQSPAQIYIRYSAHADGTDFTAEWSEGQVYMGVATYIDYTPRYKNEFTWVYIGGADGGTSYEIQDTVEYTEEFAEMGITFNVKALYTYPADIVALNNPLLGNINLYVGADNIFLMSLNYKIYTYNNINTHIYNGTAYAIDGTTNVFTIGETTYTMDYANGVVTWDSGSNSANIDTSNNTFMIGDIKYYIGVYNDNTAIFVANNIIYPYSSVLSHADVFKYYEDGSGNIIAVSKNAQNSLPVTNNSFTVENVTYVIDMSNRTVSWTSSGSSYNQNISSDNGETYYFYMNNTKAYIILDGNNTPKYVVDGEIYIVTNNVFKYATQTYSIFADGSQISANNNFNAGTAPVDMFNVLQQGGLVEYSALQFMARNSVNKIVYSRSIVGTGNTIADSTYSIGYFNAVSFGQFKVLLKGSVFKMSDTPFTDRTMEINARLNDYGFWEISADYVYAELDPNVSIPKMANNNNVTLAAGNWVSQGDGTSYQTFRITDDMFKGLNYSDLSSHISVWIRPMDGSSSYYENYDLSPSSNMNMPDNNKIEIKMFAKNPPNNWGGTNISLEVTYARF